MPDTPAILVDPSDVVAAERDPSAPLVVALTEPLAEALEAERARREGAARFQERIRSPLSENTRRERRGLLTSSVLSLAVGWAGVVLEGATVQGFRVVATEPDRLLWLLVGVTGYFLVSFTLYALADLAEGRRRGYVERSRAASGGQDSASDASGEEYVLRLARVIEDRRAAAETRRSLARWSTASRWSTVAVGSLDYVLPYLAAGAALWTLIGRILA